MLSRDDVSTSIGSLRRSGHKVTQARRAVIEALADETDHLTAPSLVKAVQKRTPSVGRATVYRTLELLTRLGLVRSSTLGGASATYVLTAGRHHHHAVCVECHKTVDFDECVLLELERRLGQKLGFRFEGHLVELYGRCPDCIS